MTVTVAIMVLAVVFEGVILAATPWLMPPTECFTVTVPPSAQNDPQVRGYRRRYAAVVGATTATSALAFALVVSSLVDAEDPTAGQLTLFTVAIFVATFAPILVATALMLRTRAQVRQLKGARGWTAVASRAVTVVTGNIPQPISLAWNLLYLALALAMVVFALAFYDRFPAQIPMHTNFGGKVTEHVAKSVGAVLFPALFTGYIGLMLAAAHAFTLISKRPVDPMAPATSAYAYGRYARLTSQMLLVGGLGICVATGAGYYLTALGLLSMSGGAVLISVVALLFVCGMAVAPVALGQSGGRLASELRTTDAIGRDDDALWRWGLFYCNADDPSIVVPKRFGVGWTINVARPAAWALMGGIIAVACVFGLLMEWAVG